MINWKLRLKNETTLMTLLCAIVAFVYQILGILGIVPSISEDSIVTAIGLVINIFVALGIIVDPTTDGIADSKQALEYDEPKCD